MPTTTPAPRTETPTLRKFGIEFEAVGLTIVRAKDILVAAGINAELPVGHGTRSANLRGNWKVEIDGSVANGFEAVTPPSVNFDESRRACQALTGAGATVNPSCGTHVHVDAHDLSLDHFKNLAKIWMQVEPSLDKLVSASRRRNHYCRSNASLFESIASAWAKIDTARSFNQLANIVQGAGYASEACRYFKLNLIAMNKHGTVEFRMHQGTLNANKIERWTKLCIRLVEIAKRAVAGQKNEFWDMRIPAEMGLHGALKAIFAPRVWVEPTTAPAATTAPTVMVTPAAPEGYRPRAGTQREALWRLFDANPSLSPAAAGDLGAQNGFDRRYSCGQHWHWRRARSFASPVPTTTVQIESGIRDDEQDMQDQISYFNERAMELAQ